MRVSNIISLSVIGASSVLAQQCDATGELGDATVTTGNPAGKVVVATLPQQPFWQGSLNGNVQGSVTARSGPNGEGVDYEVSFSNLPTEGGPFIYHLHVAPVPADGNCTSTLAHLDQFIRGEDPPCDPERPESCQQGDLSGKYGKINTTGSYSTKFHDPYTSLVEGEGSYFGNRSLVFHFANKTRITCANFTVLNGSTAPNPSGTGNPSGTAPAPTASPSIPISSASNLMGVFGNLAIAPVVVAFLALL